jgi:hypothetical protein
MSSHPKEGGLNRADLPSRMQMPGRTHPDGRGGNPRRDRLDLLERADDRTRAFDPHHGGLDDDAIDELLDAGQSNAAYRREASWETPTLGPDIDGDDRWRGFNEPTLPPLRR